MSTVAFVNAAVAERQAAILERYKFINDPRLERLFLWFAAECSRLKRDADDFKRIDVDRCSPRIVQRWRWLAKREARERTAPYREAFRRSNAHPWKAGLFRPGRVTV